MTPLVVQTPKKFRSSQWLVAATLALAALGGWELFWRSRGFRPTLEDSKELWTAERERADREGSRALVLVGTSRFQLGIDPRVLGEQLPGQAVVQLALEGSPPLPVLKRLAEDERFHGRVLVEVLPTAFFTLGGVWPDARLKDWLEFADAPSFVSPVELTLRTWLRSHFVFPISRVHPRVVAISLLNAHRLPLPEYATMRADRFRSAHYSAEDIETMSQRWKRMFRDAAIAPTAAQLDERLATVRGWVHAIQQRGGDVFFVRMISSTPVLEIEDEVFPRDRYWNKLAQNGLTGVEYRDLPGIDGLKCPEGSHLDADGAARFSRALGSYLSHEWPTHGASAQAQAGN